VQVLYAATGKNSIRKLIALKDSINTEQNTYLDAYLSGQVRAHGGDLHLLALFAPPAKRARLWPLYALATELAHIRHMVSEEMIGHIRYAWWRESLENLYAGHPRTLNSNSGHPVLEALHAELPHLPQSSLMNLVEAYAGPYPEAPTGEQEALAALTLPYLEPAEQKAWQKAHNVLKNHRTRHGGKKHSWLMLKLLLSGLTR
jgi:phytoene/squalene synthetase